MGRGVAWVVVCLCGMLLMPRVLHACRVERGLHPGSPAVYQCWVPESDAWNGELVVIAHGFVAPDQPLDLPWEQFELPDSPAMPDLLAARGYAVAVTSYRRNGLVVADAVEDIRELAQLYAAHHGTPEHTYVLGLGDGGLTAALAMERYPALFAGGVALCAPLGDYGAQLQYVVDARVIFDAFFPGLIPGSATDIPDEVLQNWDDFYAPRIAAVLEQDPGRTTQVLRAARIPSDPRDLAAGSEALQSLLHRQVVSANNLRAVLGGQPFDNTTRQYGGTDCDAWLNRTVARIAAQPAAQATLDRLYRTAGVLHAPFTSLYTLGDPLVPAWQTSLYAGKVFGSTRWTYFAAMPLGRYGHGVVRDEELLGALEAVSFSAKTKLSQPE